MATNVERVITAVRSQTTPEAEKTVNNGWRVSILESKEAYSNFNYWLTNLSKFWVPMMIVGKTDVE